MNSGISMFSSVMLPVFIIVFLFLFLFMKQGIGYLVAACLLFIIYAITFGLTVEREIVTRHIFLFQKSIHRRSMEPEDIEQILFRRTGRKRTKAVIVTREGKNVHIAEEKDEVIDLLEDYAVYHGIPWEKR